MKKAIFIQFWVLGILWGLCTIITLIMAMAQVNSVYCFYLVLFECNRAAIFGVGIALLIIPFFVFMIILIGAIKKEGIVCFGKNMHVRVCVSILCVVPLICALVGGLKWDVAKVENSNMYIGDGYILKLSQTDSGYSISAFRGYANNVVLPDTYNEKPIVAIGDEAFFHNKSGDYSNGNGTLKSIVLPNTITTIGKSAFNDCFELRKINLPKNLSVIGESAFSICRNLCGEMVIPNSVGSIGASAFYACESLTKIIIPKGVISIGDKAFSGCEKLTIYCEAESKPSGWYQAVAGSHVWYGDAKVIWGYKG